MALSGNAYRKMRKLGSGESLGPIVGQAKELLMIVV